MSFRDVHFSDVSPATVSASVLLVVIVAYVWSRNKKRARFNAIISRLPKGPKPLPIVGNALDLLGGFDRLLETWHGTWPENHGEIFVTYIGSHCNVNISSPELFEAIMSSQKILDKGADYDFFLPWLGEGLLLSAGSKWKSRRRLLTPAFHYKILDTFVGVFNKQVKILCGVLENHCCPEGFDIFPFITNCTLDIICEAAMGIETHAQIRRSDYVKAVLRINQILMERVSKPWLSSDLLFPLFAVGREHNRLLTTLHNFTGNVVNNRRAELQKNPIKLDVEEQQTGLKNRMPLIDILLSGPNDSLTNKDIREEIDTFMFEGHDTTASGIGWFLYCMASHPEYQEKVYDELRDVFGDSDRDCTQQDLLQLTYLECCIKEAMRLYSPVPNIERFTKEDVQIGEYLIPEGTSLALMLYRLHRNPRIYPDPLLYNPDRFTPENSIGRHPYAYVPFSAGPRNCIGQRFAHMEVKVTATILLRKFQFKVSPLAKKPIPSFQVVLKPLNGIELIVTPR